MVVYEGAIPYGLTHTVRRKDGTRLHVHNAHLRLKLQANLSNIPKTPLDYCKEVGQSISKEEAEALARLRVLTLSAIISLSQKYFDWLRRAIFPLVFWTAKGNFHYVSPVIWCCS